MAQNVKTVLGVARASVKTVNSVAIASVKTIQGVDNTGAGGGALDDYANLVAWYKTPIPGATDGNAIASWPDDAGANDLTASGSSPLYQTNEINGLAAVDFTSRFLNLGGSSASDFPYTLVFVAKFADQFEYQVLLGCDSAGGLLFRSNQFTTLLEADKAQTAQIGAGDVALTAGWHVIIAVITSTTWAFWIDGVDAGSGSHSETLTAGRTFTLGGDASGSAFYWMSLIAEVGIYSSDHTADVASITSDMETKYAL